MGKRQRITWIFLAVAIAFYELFAALSGTGLFLPLSSFLSGGGNNSQGAGVILSASSIGSFHGTRMGNGEITLFSGLIGGGSLAGIAAENLLNAHAFPVPWRIDLHSARNITFTNLTEKATIKIYTLSLDLVAILTHQDPFSNEKDWDLTNTEGDRVASGVYFYVIDSGTELKKGRLMVIK